MFFMIPSNALQVIRNEKLSSSTENLVLVGRNWNLLPHKVQVKTRDLAKGTLDLQSDLSPVLSLNVTSAGNDCPQ